MAYSNLTLRDIAEAAATAVVVAGALLLGLALLAELGRRRRAGSVLVHTADRLLPSSSRRIAVGIFTFLSAVTSVAGPSAASADSSLRDWLAAPAAPITTTTTTTVVPVREPTPSAAPGTVQQITQTTGSVARTDVNRSTPPPTSAAPTVADPRPSSIVHPRLGGSQPANPGPTELPTPTAIATDHLTVVAGDCLWDIAARLLGPRPSNFAIDRSWRAIYATNRAAIGADPGLIHPGLVLTLPTLDPTT